MPSYSRVSEYNKHCEKARFWMEEALACSVLAGGVIGLAEILDVHNVHLYMARRGMVSNLLLERLCDMAILDRPPKNPRGRRAGDLGEEVEVYDMLLTSAGITTTDILKWVATVGLDHYMGQALPLWVEWIKDVQRVKETIV